MLYYSSTYLQNKTFKTLEELFLHVSPNNVALVFDTNIVIYYRDFYLNPKQYIENPQNRDIVFAIRYLNEQIYRYELQVLTYLGVDESSRRKQDFSLNIEKLEQTQRAIMFLLHLDYKSFDNFIEQQVPEEPIIDKGEYPSSMIGVLNQNSLFQHPLIAMYIICLKVVLLFYKYKLNEISGKDAIMELNRFMREELDFISGIMHFLCLHLFGGSDYFKSIIIPKNRLSINKKLHKILNGAIDLVFPTIINKVANSYYKKPIPELIPIFVSTDKWISKLHSLMGLRITFNTKETYSYFPELIQTDFFCKLNWTKEEMNQFFSLSQSDISRIIKFDGQPKMTTHLLKYVKPLEKELIEYWTENSIINKI